METTNKLVQFKFAADSEMGIVISQFERLIALTKEGTTISGQHTKAIQDGAKVIVQSLGTITQSQQQTNTAITQTVAAVNQQTQAIRQGATQQAQAINQVNSSISVLGNSLNDAKNLITGAFALHEIKQFGLGVIDAKSKIDVFRLGLTQMLQSQSDVSELFPKLLELAKTTPFQVEDLMQTTIRLKAMGVATSELIPTLVTLGNAASVIGTEKLPLVAKAYTDVMNKGKLMKQEINQFAENGIPIYDLLAVSMGKTRAEIIKLAEDHKLTFSDIKKALEDASSEGGRYYNMMNIQAQTLAGRVSNLKDAYFIAKATIGDFFENTISKGIDFSQKLIKETIGSSDALNRTLNIVKSAVAAWTTYTTIVNLAQIRTTALSVAVAAKEVVMKAAQIVAGTYNLAMQALNNVISVNYNVTTASTAAARTFWATLASNPLGVVIAAVGIATSAYYAYKAAATETATSIIELARENNKEIGQLEVKKRAILQAVLATTAMKEGTEGYKKSLDTLIKTYPEYFGELNKEEASNKRIWQIYSQVNTELERKIRLMTLEAVQQETQKKAIEVGQELYKVQTQLVALGIKGIDVYDKTNIALQLQNEYRKANQASIGTDVQQSSQQIELLKKANSLNGDYNKLISDTNKALLQTNTVRNDAYRQEIARLDGLLKANKITKEQYVELEKKAQEEILNIVAKSKDEVVKIEKEKKEKAVLTAKEIAVLTKEIQQDSFKDQMNLIDAQMKLDIERANHVKKSKAEVEKDIVRIVEAAEAEKAALRKKYSDMMLASTKETDSEAAISSKELAEVLKFDMKEVEKEKKKTEAEKRKENKQTHQEWEQYQRDVQRLTKETAEVEQKARRESLQLLMSYIGSFGEGYADIARVGKRVIDDIDLISGKSRAAAAEQVANNQKLAEDAARIFGAGTEQYNQARLRVGESQKALAEVNAAASQATMGIAMMVFDTLKNIGNAINQSIVETNNAIIKSYETVKKANTDFYNTIIRNTEEAFKVELEMFTGTYEEKNRIIDEHYAKQKEYAEARDVINFEAARSQKVLEIDSSMRGSLVESSKNMMGKMIAGMYEMQAFEEQIRQQKLQREVENAAQIRDAKIKAIQEEFNAYKDAKQQEIELLNEVSGDKKLRLQADDVFRAELLAAGEAREVAALEAAKQREIKRAQERGASAEEVARIIEAFDRLIAEKHIEYQTAMGDKDKEVKLAQQELEAQTADKINGIKADIANKDAQAKDAMIFENQKYRDFVIQANKDMLESQKAMAIAQLQAEIAILRGKKNIFNSGRINAAIGDLEQAIRDLEGVGGGAQGLGDFFTEKIKNEVIRQRKEAKTPFNAENLQVVTEAYDRDGNVIQLTYTDEDREFVAYDKNKNAFKVRNATGFVEKTGETFFKGTNYLELNGNPSGVDTIPAIVAGTKLVHLDEGERILSRKDNEKIGGKSISNQTVVEGFKVFETLSKNFPMVDFSALASVKVSMPKNIKPKDNPLDAKLLEEMKGIRQELIEVRQGVANGLVKINVDSDAVSVERVSGQLTQKYYNQFKNS